MHSNKDHHDSSFISRFFNKIFRLDKKSASTIELDKPKENGTPKGARLKYPKYDTINTKRETIDFKSDTIDFKINTFKNSNGLTRKKSKSIQNLSNLSDEVNSKTGVKTWDSPDSTKNTMNIAHNHFETQNSSRPQTPVSFAPFKLVTPVQTPKSSDYFKFPQQEDLS
jgi:hypothetical protein